MEHRARSQRASTEPVGSTATERAPPGDAEALLAASPRQAAQRQAIAGSFGTAPLQRLSVEGTAWGAATQARVTTGSGQGVAIVDDGGDKVVLKGRQPWANEVVAISNLMAEVLKPQKGENAPLAEYARAVTAKARVLSAGEANTAANQVQALAPAIPGDANRKPDVVADIRTPITLVYAYVPGKDFQDFLDANNAPQGAADKISEKRVLGGRGARRNGSPIAKFWTDPGPMYQIGKASAVDLISGNGDRLLSYFNPKNFRLDDDNGVMVFIDNLAKNTQSFLTDVAAFHVTARDAFDAWAAMAYVNDFITGNDGAVADLLLQNLANDLGTSVRAEDQAHVQAQLQAQQAAMKAWFLQGLASGREALKQITKQPDKLLAGTEPGAQRELKINLVCRFLAVQYQTRDYAFLRDVAKMQLGIL